MRDVWLIYGVLSLAVSGCRDFYIPDDEDGGLQTPSMDSGPTDGGPDPLSCPCADDKTNMECLPQTPAHQITAGNAFTCIVQDDQRSLACAGTNGNGQFGNGDTNWGASISVVDSPPAWRSISAGGQFTCGIDTNSALHCWGRNRWGQLGIGTIRRSTESQLVGNARWLTIEAGDEHVCGIHIDGTLWCWGSNLDGQLGLTDDSGCNVDPDSGGRFCTVPTQVGIESDWVEVSAGGRHTCGRRADGSAWCWGYNSDGRAGFVERESKLVPTPLDDGRTYTAISAGWAHSCAIAEGGQLYCWGENTHGRLGIKDLLTNARRPELVDLEKGFRSVSVGRHHSCAVAVDDTLWCWGRNNIGQSDGTACIAVNGEMPSCQKHVSSTVPDDILVPTRIGSLHSWAMTSAGDWHTCALTNQQTVHCWGRNNDWQLGHDIDEPDRICL